MKPRLLLFALLVLLFVVGILTGFLVREWRQEYFNRSLIAAIKAHKADRAIALLDAGANANVKDIGVGPITFAEMWNHLLNAIQGQPKPEATYQPTALILATTWDQDKGPPFPENPDLIRTLLRRGADPNVTDADLQSPILCAINRDYNTSVRLLLQYGADVQTTKNSFDLLHHAIRNAPLGADPETIRILIVYGADLNSLDGFGNTPLICAISDPNIVQILLQAHADVNAKDAGGRTVLDAAIKDKEAEMQQMLRQSGAKTGEELDAEAKRGK